MSDTAFAAAMTFTIHAETGGRPDGGYTDDPDDAGGETKWGISKRAHPELDIRNLTYDQARDIYLREYWQPGQCDRMPPAVAVAHFDCAVMSGVGRAAKIFQGAIGTAVDGELGPLSFAALESYLAGRGPHITAGHLVRQRARFIVELADQPEIPAELRRLKYLKGWVVRLVELAGYVCRVA